MKTMNYSLIRILFALVIGLVLVIWPNAAASYIVITVGVAFLIPGVISLFGYFGRKRPEGEAAPRFPIEGIGSLLFGLWLIVMPEFFADVLMFLLGFILIMGGVQQIASLSMARRWMPVPGAFYLIPSLILIAGIIALFNPTGARNTAFIIIGISSLVYSLSELINWFKFARRRPKARLCMTMMILKTQRLSNKKEEDCFTAPLPANLKQPTKEIDNFNNSERLTVNILQ